MALISSRTIITSISLFHLTLSFFFLVNPSAIDDQAIVFILGESMHLPIARGFDAQAAPLSLLAVVLSLVGLSDLVSLSMPEEASALYFWGTQAPLRFTFSIAVVFFIYFSSSPPSSHSGIRPPSFPASAWGTDGIKNRVVFTFMFIEMISWFWVWVTLREERPAVVDRARRSRSQA